MSDSPIVAQKGPYQVALEAGKPYFWCTCGRSAKQPYCDGSHKGTPFQPKKFQVDAAGTFNLGAHNML
jgi:CDGSH iron-sulfur domain-containing protein 3